jgi:toxin YoeB
VNVTFHQNAFEEYRQWAREDIQIFAKINSLITDIMRDPIKGLGKPEPLKHELSGFWSRRITDEHRLMYQVSGEQLIIASCKFHYSK